MSNASTVGSGDGTRPTTSRGVDNIGGAEKFSPTRNSGGEDVSGPAPQERMQDRRKGAEASKNDDSAAFGLKEDLTPVPNREPEQGARPRDPAEREAAIRRAAYEAYERRGGEAGHETQDWLDAEAEVDRQDAARG